MKLRNQLIIVFFLFSVVPLTGVTLWSYYSSIQAFRQAVEAESGAMATEMERRMEDVTSDLQRRIDRVSGLPYWASLGDQDGFHEWSNLTDRLRQEMGDAAPLLEHIEFTPVAPEREPTLDLPGVEETAAPSMVVIEIPEEGPLEGEVVVERVGDRVVVHQRSYAVPPAPAAGTEAPARDGDGSAPEDAAGARVEDMRERFEEFNQGLLALSQELSERDQKRRAGIAVPVAGPDDFAFLLARKIGTEVERNGRRLGRVQAQVSTRQVLGRVLSRTRRERGEIPFALDAEGDLYTPDPADLPQLEALALKQRVQPDGTLAGPDPDPTWVTVLKVDPASGLTFGIARPVGDSLAEMRNASATNLAIGLALVGLALGGILPLSRRMTHNLDRLTRGAERLAAGDLQTRVPARSKDEFGKLAGTFNRMARELSENQQRLLEQERLRRELEISRQIQQDLLPRGTYRTPQAHVKGFSVPAKELGGDFFNYFPLEGGELGVLVGDVSGKGVGAALLMANIQATLKARLPVERDLARLTNALDREIADNTPDEVYVTLFLGILDAEGKELRYVNAGHTPTMAVHSDGSVDRLASGGRPPGLLPGGGYVEQRVRLGAGDYLFLYTDGLVEAEDRDGQPFGVERLQVLLVQERELTLDALLTRVENALRDHHGGLEAADDATLVALRIPVPEREPAGAATTGTSRPPSR